MSGPTFEAVVAPLGTAARNYLEARGLTTLRLLAHAAADESAFTEAIVAPFIAGFQVGDVDHKHDGDRVLITALFTIAWTDARASGAPPAQPAPPAALHAPALPAAGPVKIPITLAMGEWRSYVDRFEERWGGKRRFPVDVLLGAESVLARLLHELHVSKTFTPLGLGEILAVRAYTASGQVNPYATRKLGTQALGLTVKGGTTELAVRETEYDPRTVWACLDGLEAVKWAFTWACYTESDSAADAWVEPFRRFARNHPSELPLLRSLYDAAAWKLALGMRAGGTFD